MAPRRPGSKEPDHFFAELNAARQRIAPVGLPEEDAREAARQANCYVTVAKRDGAPLPVTAECATNRIFKQRHRPITDLSTLNPEFVQRLRETARRLVEERRDKSPG